MKWIDRGELGRIPAAAAISRSGLDYIKFIIYELLFRPKIDPFQIPFFKSNDIQKVKN